MRRALAGVALLAAGLALADITLKNQGTTVGPVLALDCSADAGMACARSTTGVGGLSCRPATGTALGCISTLDQTVMGAKVFASDAGYSVTIGSGDISLAGGDLASSRTGQTFNITSATNSTTATSSVGAFTFTPASMGSNDLVIDIQDGASGHAMTLDEDGDAVLNGDLSLVGGDITTPASGSPSVAGTTLTVTPGAGGVGAAGGGITGVGGTAGAASGGSAGGAGGAISFTGAIGATASGSGAGAAGAGGAVTLATGAGGAGSTGAGAIGGTWAATAGAGGAASASAGASAAGGAMTITAGAGGAAATARSASNGGAITITTGAGGTAGGLAAVSSGAGGDLTLKSGAGGGINNVGAGAAAGTVILDTGAPSGGNTGDINIGVTNATAITVGRAAGTITVDGKVALSSALNRGEITLGGGGTGTATVLGGAICVCSEITDATKTLKCVVSSTTLTATGTATDHINYICL